MLKSQEDEDVEIIEMPDLNKINNLPQITFASIKDLLKKSILTFECT